MNPKHFSLRVVTLLILLLASVSGPVRSGDFRCEVRVLEPRPGQEMASRITIAGNAVIPDGHHLWVFARRIDFRPLWWAQGEGTFDGSTGNWSAFATLGGPEDVSWDFELTAAVVTREQHLKLRENLLKAMQSGNFRPIEMPAAACVAGAVKVKKTGQ